ncbi:thiamine phosphate synthase [Halarcobacter ebronensis]|uniref:Thiamine-phosphate synthase n=1 Tax=Halarcobacter ebronensis TaxID=1462615 RepID=A0A4Q1AF63_9BACT|nr:thiamine phosphate synthase [Halarcobacter ebronensis]QKF81885.1 thiamine phosphate synthase (TMP-TENI domain) [Halarcobacter ebronensis]RXK02151.1 thiamine phosphate synthase [Halarcobacter ebronensis]
MLKKLKGLYVISDDLLTPKNTMLVQIEESLKGGAKIVQLRDKQSSDEDIEKIVLDIQNLCRRYKALFVLNDRVDLAIKLKCDGLHVGESDHYRIDKIREKYWGYLGVSCYGNLELAKEMENKRVDYVAFGSFFSSPTKPNAKVVDIDIIKEAKEHLNIPVCAIGGITTQNVSKLLTRGVDMVAVITDIWKSTDIKQKSEIYKKLMD